MTPLAWLLVILLIVIILALAAMVQHRDRIIDDLFYELAQDFEHPELFADLALTEADILEDLDQEYPERIVLKEGFDYVLEFEGDEE